MWRVSVLGCGRKLQRVQSYRLKSFNNYHRNAGLITSSQQSTVVNDQKDFLDEGL